MTLIFHSGLKMIADYYNVIIQVSENNHTKNLSFTAKLQLAESIMVNLEIEKSDHVIMATPQKHDVI
jgi:hypothetical protein